ncbi:MAG: hypothetical protein HUU50_05730 [Candidatus Brocadiae bacterium]|nr:hypothetical protein [Candidatus Brocadiia bacterium]
MKKMNIPAKSMEKLAEEFYGSSYPLSTTHRFKQYQKFQSAQLLRQPNHRRWREYLAECTFSGSSYSRPLLQA